MSNTPNRRRRPPTGGSASSNRWIVWGVLGVIALVAVIAVVVVAASGGGNDQAAKKPAKFQTAPQLTATGTSLPQFDSTTRDTAVGMTAPTLDSVNFAGQSVQVGGATGKPYALVFLAHWCPHCQAEVPRLVSLAKGAQIAGVDLVGIPTNTTDQAPNYPPSAWLAREKWPFPVLLDTAKGKAAAAYGLSAFPYFVFVDAQGKVVGRTTGEIAPDQVQAIFAALAKGQALPLPGAGASSSAR
jgi:cytochrome c biogenesis protein CcmG/thiol:disulfide interchange protein DsbE